MNKKYLPAIASLFIIAMIAASVVPAYAQTLLSPRSVPSLVVKTIAEDDEMRKTGIILLGMTTPSFDFDALFNTYNPFEFPAVFVIAIIAAAVVPAYAQTILLSPRAVPSLVVKTIAEDDEMRKTGIILLGMTTPSTDFDTLFQDVGQAIQFPAVVVTPGWLEPNVATSPKFLSQFKLLVSFNGVPVTPTTITCQVIEKDKVNPIKDKQFPAENLKTRPVDQSQNFVCKFRPAKPGVGVLDVYYVGPTTGQYIADYVLNVGASVTIGRNVVFGQEIQDICVLGWPSTLVMFDIGDASFAFKPVIITKPDGTTHVVYPDALGTVANCEDMVLMQHYALGLTIPWD